MAENRLAELSRMMGSETHKRDDTVFNQGDYGDALYVIQDGSVRISQVSEDGHELILIVLCTGDFFGEMSLLDGEPRSAAAIAAEDAALLSLRRSDFMRFLGQNPTAAVEMRRVLSLRLRRMDGVLEEAVFHSATVRIARRLIELLSIYGQDVEDGHLLDARLTQSELAEMVGTSRVTVNKELADMESRASSKGCAARS
ncbi:MAG: Crp/Fnr family transcriptional regulator [Chloroflexota bacterium]|nr:Crp/Fnr family transcriptional regulator [Chloroflexota bacterium]